jgi:hypothetical protein
MAVELVEAAFVLVLGERTTRVSHEELTELGYTKGAA